MNGDPIATLRRHRPELPSTLVVTACMGTLHDASASVYRSMPLRAPEAPSRDESVEVTTAWGDEVLTVAHLRRGEHLALPYAHIDAAACTVTVPEGTTAWVLRDGVCAPRVGDTLTLERATARACSTRA